MHTLILLAATTPPVQPEPTLRPGLTADQVGPGFLGFLVTFGIVVVMFFLIRDMIKRNRRVRYRAQVAEQEQAAVERAAEQERAARDAATPAGDGDAGAPGDQSAGDAPADTPSTPAQ
ncbi:hypothetical protein [Specibacter cremeus]|uniref:hypothetical protein n=1 Tax=Specibacter cremeus TaxID=1629051 RepID=UPI000F798102|nr:hypothetical protein [Specibacter cremeus]